MGITEMFMATLYKNACSVVNKHSGLKSDKRTCRLFVMDFADRLRQRRKLLKLTQVQLAEKAGMTQQLIQQLETRKVLTTGRIIALAGALECNPKWLETGEGPMQGDELSTDEREMLKEYRGLTSDKKPIARMTLRAMYTSIIEDVKPNFPAAPNVFSRCVSPEQLSPPQKHLGK